MGPGAVGGGASRRPAPPDRAAGRAAPGRPLSRRTKLLLLVVAAATVAVYVWSFTLSTTKDRPDQLDTKTVSTAAGAACARLRTGIAGLPALPPGAPTAERQERIREQNGQIDGLVAAVRAVGQPALDKDVPATAWLADWEALAAARSAYAAAGAAGPFSPPATEGRTLPDRMGRIGVAACTVPAALLASP